MAVRAVFVAAAALAVGIAMLLPVPHKDAAEAAASTIPTIEIGRG